MAPFSPVSEQASYSARIDSLYSAENERRTGVLRRSLPSGAVPSSMCHVLACSDFTSAGGWRRPAAVVPLVLAMPNTLLALDADRKSVVKGKSVSGRVDPGGRRIITKKNLVPTDKYTKPP